MTYPLRALTVALLTTVTALTTVTTVTALTTVTAQAQSAPAPAPATGRPPLQLSTDFIVSVVNAEPITSHEVLRELKRIKQAMPPQDAAKLDNKDLARQVLERLINDKVQLQFARETGLKIEDAALDLAEQNIARQNQISLAALHQRLATEGVSSSQFRAQLRDQLTLTRLRERDVEPRVRVSDLEIAQYQREQQSKQINPPVQALNLSQILIAVPESPAPALLAKLEKRAMQTLNRARIGEDFVTLARDFSDAPDAAKGGQLGLRNVERYPTVFVEATQALEVGEIADLVRSDAGFHILKVMDKTLAGPPVPTVTQHRARHILLRLTPTLTEASAKSKLSDYKKQIAAGKADFVALARTVSQDGSAAQGGDLGWAGPGMFVPEFEEALSRLAPGQVSEPVVSRFGVHLIQLVERRKVALNPREQKEALRALLRDKKSDEAYATWLRDLRSRAYVESREQVQ